MAINWTAKTTLPFEVRQNDGIAGLKTIGGYLWLFAYDRQDVKTAQVRAWRSGDWGTTWTKKATFKPAGTAAESDVGKWGTNIAISTNPGKYSKPFYLNARESHHFSGVFAGGGLRLGTRKGRPIDLATAGVSNIRFAGHVIIAGQNAPRISLVEHFAGHPFRIWTSLLYGTNTTERTFTYSGQSINLGPGETVEYLFSVKMYTTGGAAWLAIRNMQGGPMSWRYTTDGIHYFTGGTPIPNVQYVEGSDSFWDGGRQRWWLIGGNYYPLSKNKVWSVDGNCANWVLEGTIPSSNQNYDYVWKSTIGSNGRIYAINKFGSNKILYEGTIS